VHKKIVKYTLSAQYDYDKRHQTTTDTKDWCINSIDGVWNAFTAIELTF